MKIVTYLVDRLLRRAGQRTSSLGKGVFFEEIADFVSRGEKVVVADVALG